MRVLICAGVLLWAAALTRTDLREQRLPDALTLPGAATIIGVAAAQGRGVQALAGAGALAGIYLLIHLLAPRAMGAGDVKLAIGLGGLTAALGGAVWVLAALGAPLLTAIVGSVAAACGWGPTLPHGPSMCVASLGAAAVAVC